jgi:1,4-dihydroxy-2-naphthoate octaprenyltransferase
MKVYSEKGTTYTKVSSATKDIKYILGPMRLPFLILTPACLLLGIGTAFCTGANMDQLSLVLIVVAAISAHISVNTFNEYFDFKSGLDFRTKRSPFSGGSGTLIEKPEKAKYALYTGWISLILTAIIGIYFLIVRGLLLLPIGLAGLVLIYSYTIWITRFPFLCLIAPGTGFGIIMVSGTHFALTGEYSPTAFVASLIPFFLVNNLLLLNQFPDVDADKTVGRKHFPISYGERLSTKVYGAFLLLTYLLIILAVYFNLLPPYCLLGLLTIFFALPVYRGVSKHANEPEMIKVYLGLNVVIVILTPVLISVGLFLR